MVSLRHRSQSRQCRSTKVRYQDHSSHIPGPTMGAMEAAQTPALPLRAVTHKAYSCKASPIPATGAPIVLLPEPKKEAAMAGPAPLFLHAPHPLATVLCFCGSLGFFHIHPPLQPYNYSPAPSGCLRAANPSTLPKCVL